MSSSHPEPSSRRMSGKKRNNSSASEERTKMSAIGGAQEVGEIIAETRKLITEILLILEESDKATEGTPKEKRDDGAGRRRSEERTARAQPKVLA